MSLPTLVVIHGRDRRWPDQASLARAWETSLRAGLRRVGAPWADDLPMRFVDYGAAWRDLGQPDDVSAVQAEFATELLERSSDQGAAPAPWSMWSGVGGLVDALGQQAGIDDPAVLELFLNDLAEYFRDGNGRASANGAVAAEAGAAEGDVILLAHGVGSIASYVSLANAGESLGQVRGLVTFGSPLGMDAVRTRVDAIAPGVPFPAAPRRWINIFDELDFAATVPRLEPIFRALDGRRVEDEAVADQRQPGAGRGRAHDASRYFGSIEFASRLQQLIGELDPTLEASLAAQVPAAQPGSEEPAAEPETVAREAEAPATRSWPGAPSPAGAAPPWLDGAAPPWVDGAAPPWLDPDEDEK